MSLIAHFPLIDNLDDYSGNNYHDIINTNNGVFTDGRLGQGLFVESNNGIVINMTRLVNDFGLDLCDETISFWMKSPVDVEEIEGGAFKELVIYYGAYYGDNSGGFGLLSQNFNAYLRGSGAPGWTNTQSNLNAKKMFANIEWIHYTLVFKGRERVKFYMNNQLFFDIFLATPNKEYSNKTLTMGKNMSATVNDIRIYDRALDEMEIKEITKAKMLHLVMDKDIEGTYNYAQNDLIAYGSYYTYTREDKDTHKAYRFLESTNATLALRSLEFTNAVSHGMVYTISGYLYKNGIPYETNVNHISTIHNTTIRKVTRPDGYFEYTQIFVDTTNSPWIIHSAMGNAAPGDTLELKYLQIEFKDSATPYTQTEREDSFLNDISDYRFKGEVYEKSPKLISSSKIGLGAYRFNGIDTSINFGSILNLRTEITVSAWVRYNDSFTGGILVKGDDGGWASNSYMFMRTISSRAQIRITGSDGYLNYSVPNIGDNKWHHIAMTFDPESFKVYIDGRIVHDVENTIGLIKSTSSGRLMLGKGHTGSWFTGDINEVRVYATSLDEKDIVDMYRKKAEVTEEGVLYAYDFVSDIEPTVNILQNYPISNTVSKDHGSSGTTTWTINHPVLAGEEYVISADFLRNKEHDGRIYCMFSLVDENGVQVPGNSGLVPGWGAMVNEALYKYFHTDIKTKANNEWYRHTLPVIKIPEGYSNGKIVWIRFTVAVNPTDASFITSFKNVQFEKRSEPTGFVSNEREHVVLPENIELNSNKVYEQGVFSFNDYSTVGITKGMTTYIPLNSEKIEELSGGAYNITTQGTPESRGDYFYFDGTNQQINTGNTYPTEWNQPYTILLEVKIPSTLTTTPGGYNAGILSRGSYAGSQGICVDASISNFRMYFRTDGKVNDHILGPVIKDQWFFLAVTWNGASILNGYYNDIKKPLTITDMSGSPTTTNPSWLITPSMAFGGASGGRIPASIRNVKIFNRALSEEEIKLEYNTMFKNEVQIHKSGVVYAKDIRQQLTTSSVNNFEKVQIMEGLFYYPDTSEWFIEKDDGLPDIEMLEHGQILSLMILKSEKARSNYIPDFKGLTRAHSVEDKNRSPIKNKKVDGFYKLRNTPSKIDITEWVNQYFESLSSKDTAFNEPPLSMDESNYYVNLRFVFGYYDGMVVLENEFYRKKDIKVIYKDGALNKRDGIKIPYKYLDNTFTINVK